jgi:dinuclear metal center YbgI/SA1388 family protein
MANASLKDLVAHCDNLLGTKEFPDYDGAVNGLQVENDGTVSKIAAAVDASLATVKLAVETKADLLVVHHGLFWGPTHPWTGKRYELQRLLIENNVAIYSAHLPLDAHAKLGNNAQLSAALGFKNLTPFYAYKDRTIGLQTTVDISRTGLSRRLVKALGSPAKLLPGGNEKCKRIGIVTGGAGSGLKQAADEGIDTFITGEGPHWTFPLAEELGLNVFYGGHYATETFGVKALSEYLSKKYKLPWTFIDHPSGL